MHTLKFAYDKRGHGNLELIKDNDLIREWAVRTGSIDGFGKLINPLPVGTYKILVPSEFTTESAMVINGTGWKIRLYTANGDYTHYLIHPDGGLGGTLGCIGLIGTIGLPLKEMLDNILKEQTQILVEVTNAA